MNIDGSSLTIALQDQLRDELAKQPWWQRISNTVTATVTGLLTLAWWLASSGLDLPGWMQAATGVLVFLAGVLGIKATRNGLTDSVASKVTRPEVVSHALQRAQAGAAHLHDEATSHAEQARDSFVERTEQVGDDLAARAAELAESLSTLRADNRTGFVQLPDGRRARIQLSVTPER